MNENQAWKSLHTRIASESSAHASHTAQEIQSPWSSGVWKSSPTKISIYNNASGPRRRGGRPEEIIKAPPRAHRLRSFGRTGAGAFMSLGTSLLLGICGAMMIAIVGLLVF